MGKGMLAPPPRTARCARRVASGPEPTRRLDGYARSVLSPRNRELLGLLPSALLVTGGFTAIFIQAEDNAPGASTNITLN